MLEIGFVFFSISEIKHRLRAMSASSKWIFNPFTGKMQPMKIPDVIRVSSVFFIVLGHFETITARFFGVLAARFHFFMNKYDASSLKCLLTSCFNLRRQ